MLLKAVLTYNAMKNILWKIQTMKGLTLYGIFVFYLISSSRATDNFASKCCGRVPDVMTVGKGISGKLIKLDKGRCTTSCKKIIQQRNHNESMLLKTPNKQQNQPEIAMCDLGKSRRPAICEPSLVHSETLAFNQGPKFYEIVDQCVCRKVPRRCERVSKTKRFFVGTEFEAAVDIGECRGRCKKRKDGKICKSTRTTSNSIIGPNGSLSVKIIKECRCEPSCYRKYFNIAVIEKTENADGNTIFKTKVIDVGRCAGNCKPIKQCVYKDKENGKCLMSLKGDDVTCSPIRIHHITYTNGDGNDERVPQIRRCGCK